MEILSHPSPPLATESCEVDPMNDDALRSLVERMAKLMYEAPGIGLAAPQIGVMKKVIVFDLSEDASELTALCNPRIVEASEECEVDEEGCLSLPGISVPVNRACRVIVEAQTLEGDRVRIEADGLQARMFQHECDHLAGKLIIDRATPEERKAALRRYREAQEMGARAGGNQT